MNKCDYKVQISDASDIPAKACNVVPPMWQAATPVLAVAKVCCGGSDPVKKYINRPVQVCVKNNIQRNIENMDEITVSCTINQSHNGA